MTDKEIIRASNLLGLVLRHEPERRIVSTCGARLSGEMPILLLEGNRFSRAARTNRFWNVNFEYSLKFDA